MRRVGWGFMATDGGEGGGWGNVVGVGPIPAYTQGAGKG